MVSTASLGITCLSFNSLSKLRLLPRKTTTGVLLLNHRGFVFHSESWNVNLAKKTEQKWRKTIEKEIRSLKIQDRTKKPYYVLSMFPYPSGQLHMGHVRVYTLSDAFAHYHRMQGKEVIHPMGWDAFGLPAENAAIERNINPKVWTEENIENMRSQMQKLGCIFDWNRELNTCDPEYYKWTQFLFLKLYERGLAYQKEAMVNWDPVDKTVLADEQVDETGRSWRSGAKVEKRPLRQWFFRTTEFSQKLRDQLEDTDLVNWRDIIKIQQNWIGECNGTRFRFNLRGTDITNDFLDLWTQKPELIFGVSFIGISKDNVLNQQRFIKRETYCPMLNCKVLELNIKALNPFNNKEIPVFLFKSTEDSSSFLASDLFSDGSDNFIGIPEASKLIEKLRAQLCIEECLPVLSIDGKLQNSGEFSGMIVEEARPAILEKARSSGFGGAPTSSKLRDWLISRQRFWGTPIPIIHCENCGTIPVPENQLPVELPDLDNVSTSEKGIGLEKFKEWMHVECPQCNATSRRETDTMDTFVDSSWYFLRYLDSRNKNELVNTDAAKALPVDIYIGGKEHATLHLYFARFISHFLNEIGLSPVKEPFQKLLVQGMVKGKSYRVKGTGKYLSPSEVVLNSNTAPGLKKMKEVAMEKSSGKPVVVEWEKMSKSKKNGIDPNEILERYGCDTTRLMMLCDVGPASDRNWSEDSYPRIRNMMIRLCKLVSLSLKLQEETLPEMCEKVFDEERSKLWDARNYYLKFANHSYNTTFNLQIVIARVQSFLNDLWKTPGQIKRDSIEFQRGLINAIILLTPMAPHICAELWNALRQIKVKHCAEEFLWSKSIFHQPWPQLDSNYNLKLVVTKWDEELVSIPVAKSKFDTLTKEEAFDLACQEPIVHNLVLTHQFQKKFHKFSEFEATLAFYVKENREERLLQKKKYKEEKALKKLKRQKRIEEMRKAQERKSV